MTSSLRRAADWYLRTRWAQWLAVAAVVAAAALLTLGRPWLHDDLNPYRIDVDVYRLGGRMILEGRSLYGAIPATEIGAELPFTYPPIAALFFAVFAVMPLGWASFLLSLATVAAIVAVVHLVLREMTDLRGARSWAATAGASAVLLWLDPVKQTVDFGQVNSLLMLLVVVDVLLGRGRWWRGSLIGLAIAIKLTPAVFLAFFLVRRDWRALAVTLASFAAWTGIGFAVRWSDSIQYWSDTLGDTDRIGQAGYASNQSWNGFIHRVLGDDVSSLWWVLGCAVVGLFVLALIHRLDDDEAAGMTVMGLYALFASPVSWSHHWVWMVPMVLVVARLALRGGGWAPYVWLAAAAVTLFDGPQWREPYEGEAAYHWPWWQQILGTSWLWLLLAGYALLWFRADGERRPALDRPVPDWPNGPNGA
ncbi:glycosyltransferase 87 family protein [Tessaracoccus oleiagri]|uniref:Alpha-1,2-mannosyltransferase n=1 Tax=Tessaracoccus oleiagri TaxID=686624 RepID=A0A1G9HVG5_9ACTN|nr:glycosyltransferase 87 family protein [Tessaracoccus oleiagri]SDL16553.1 alpha-1,2-mannosyltransferase [Tessaracoccus oleiagri]